MLHICHLLALAAFLLSLIDKHLSYLFITFNIKLSSAPPALSLISALTIQLIFLPPYLRPLSAFCRSFPYFIFSIICFLISSSPQIHFKNGSCILKNWRVISLGQIEGLCLILSCLTTTKVLAPLSAKKRGEIKTKTPSFLFWLFLLPVKLKTPLTCYREQLPEAPLFDPTLYFRKTHGRIPDGEILVCSLSSPDVSESTPPEMRHSSEVSYGRDPWWLQNCVTLW